MLIKDPEQKTAIAQLEDAYTLYIALVKAKEEINSLQTKNQELEEEIARLKEQLQLAQQRHFGKKTETGEATSSEGIEPQEPGELETVTGYERRKKKKSLGRLLDTASLPRFCIHHDIADGEKICACCQGPLHLIGTEKSEQLEILPQRFFVAEHTRYKYGCRGCDRIQMAPKEPAPIPKALAGASLLTEVVVNKYQYHLPLYRQSKIIESYGLNIPDNTLGNWVHQLGKGLDKLYDALWQAITQTGYLQVDETPVKVLKPEKKGYLWSYYGPLLGLVVFELSLTRSAEVAENRLKDFKGLLQTDGYAGYSGLRKREGIAGLGCLSHARRKFSEVFKVSKNKKGIAAQAIEMLKPVYALEERMRVLQCSFHTRKRLRQKIAWPILKEFKKWLKKILPQAPPKSQLAKAIKYTLNQWPYIIRYLRHGIAEIDTNWVENEIRNIALGKKNWLFIGNAASGKHHALFYSLVLSAILNGLNPRVYMHYLITKIHDIRQGRIDASLLLPHVIDKKILQTFSEKIISEGKTILNAL